MSGYPGVDLVNADGQLMLRHQPAPDRPPFGVDTLKELIRQAGHGHWHMLEDQWPQAIVRANAGEVFEAPIAERRDAAFEIDIAPDAMCAWVALTPAQGGAPIDPHDIVLALAQSGVVYGIDEPALVQLCQAPQGGRVAAALGKPAQNGEDARFELLVDVTRDRRPKVDENGLIDFRELGDIPVVDEGQPLMRIIPDTVGFLGRNVRAEVLEPLRGRPEQFADKLVGAKVDDDDPRLLVALFKGQPVNTGNGVMVEQVIYFKGASMASGNIAFDGTVHIEGDVLTGMKVRATGDIIVTGIVDGGHLEAGGSIRVGGGIIAQASVRAGDAVTARFAENSRIEAGIGIAIDTMSLQCELQAGNQVIVGAGSPQRGRLVGGSVSAMMLVRTPWLGDPASSVTQVLVGVNPALEAEYQRLVATLEKQNEEEENLGKLVQHLTRQGDKTGVLDRVRANWKQSLQAVGELLVRKQELDHQMAFFGKARVDIGMGLSGSVDLAFGKTSRRLRRPYENGSFSVEGGLILFTPREGEAAVVEGQG